jgi:hypothetical protein
MAPASMRLQHDLCILPSSFGEMNVCNRDKRPVLGYFERFLDNVGMPEEYEGLSQSWSNFIR